MEGHLQHQQVYGGLMNIDTTGGGGGGHGDSRFPQWSIQETRDFLLIRSEFDPNFMETKRNKLLWEAIASKMRDQGYNRSSDQCKCKWKNLVTRYKGCETMEGEAMRQQFPFYNELHAIFTARMQRMLWMEAEGVGGGKKRAVQLLSDDEDDDEDNSEGEKGGIGSSNKKKRKIKNIMNNNPSNSSSGEIVNAMKGMLDDLMKQQMEMEMEWLRSYEAREEERRMKEMEFRQTMERLENERLMMERSWREREEERKMREEVRAEKRDALITALLNKLRRDEM